MIRENFKAALMQDESIEMVVNDLVKNESVDTIVRLPHSSLDPAYAEVIVHDVIKLQYYQGDVDAMERDDFHGYGPEISVEKISEDTYTDDYKIIGWVNV